jgi:hypothetical protein
MPAVAAVVESRPSVEDLSDVDEEEYVYRFVSYNAWQDNAPDGKHLLPAFLDSREFKPGANSYGASAWIASKLDAKGGIAALEHLEPRLKNKGLIKVQVRHVRALNITVKHTPHDADYPQHSDAHASFINVDRTKRALLMDHCQTCIVRAPLYGSTKPP